MQPTNLIKTQQNQLPAITSKNFNALDQFFYRMHNAYTIGDYEPLNLHDENYRGADLARFHIGNVLKLVYRVVGLKPENEPEPQLAKVIAKYIQVTYPYITPEEIYTAFELCLQGKYLKNAGKDNDLDHYQMMDLRYINRMLQAYVKFRFDGMNSMKGKLELSSADYTTRLRRQMPENDKAIKALIIEAFTTFKDKPKEQGWKIYLRAGYFDWLVEISWMKYDRPWLQSKYKLLRTRDPKLTMQEAKNRVKILAIGNMFAARFGQKEPFKKFEQHCYLDLYLIEELIAAKHGQRNF